MHFDGVAGLQALADVAGGRLDLGRREFLAHRAPVTAAVAVLARTGLDPAQIDEVIFGCVGQPIDAANAARVIALRAGVPAHVPAITVHRNCASGFEAITQAAEQIAAGRGDIFLVGGTERFDSMIIEETNGRVITKVGAEGVHSAVILDQSIGIALKVEDGNPRAQHPALIRLLQELDALPDPLPPRLAEILRKPVRNSRGEIVGETTIAAARRSGVAIEAAAI